MAKYLKDFIGMTSDGTLTARIGSIGLVQENKNGKEFRKVQFIFPSTGVTHEEGVFEFNFREGGNLQHLQVGDMIETKLEKGWPIFKILKSDAEQTVQPSQTNSGQVKSERAASNGVIRDEEKSIAISLQGFMQQIIPSLIVGRGGQGTQEGIVADALSYAVAARTACIAKAKELHSL